MSSSVSQCKGLILQMLNSRGAGIICGVEERMVARLQTPGTSAGQPRVGTSKQVGLAVGAQQMGVAVSIKPSENTD